MVQLLRHFQSLPATGCVATIGNFDGLHRGHVALLQELIAEAKARQLPSVVVLFEPQPLEFLRPEQAPVRLTSLREKLKLLSQLSIDFVVCLHFDRHLADLSAKEFILNILVKKLHVKHLLVGDDFRFGKKAARGFYFIAAVRC